MHSSIHPSILLLNPTSIAKPNALDHLKSDILAFNPDIVVLVESWLKPYHLDVTFNIPGYILFRRDRAGRKGGGVAIYCRPALNPTIFIPITPYAAELELLWITATVANRCYYIGGIYHPPKPRYDVDHLLSTIDTTLDEIYDRASSPIVMLLGDFNQIPSLAILKLGLIPEFEGPTHAGHPLDRIYASEKLFYSCVAITSTVSTKHAAVLSHSVADSAKRPVGSADCSMDRADRYVTSFRLRTPGRMAALHTYLENYPWTTSETDRTPIAMFADFYTTIETALDRFSPLSQVTIRDKDPPYMTPYIKYLLRKRCKLLRKHRFEKATTIAARINKAISRCVPQKVEIFCGFGARSAV
jgi:hypothetical protein